MPHLPDEEDEFANASAPPLPPDYYGDDAEGATVSFKSDFADW